MNHHSQTERLVGFSARLEELFERVSGLRGADLMTPELADEIAATAGEIMVELADQRGDQLVRSAIDDARRLREVVRTLRPEVATVAAAGRALVGDLALVIREEKRAA